jgi:hypothetical protein
MYLETTHALGAATTGVVCADGFKTNTAFCSDESFTACASHGGYNTGVVGCPKPKRIPYDLVGTATNWSYPNCKAGYTKKSSGKPHPNAYTCF